MEVKSLPRVFVNLLGDYSDTFMSRERILDRCTGCSRRGRCIANCMHYIGIGAVRRQVSIITTNEEEKLWESGVLSSDSSAYILYVVYSTISMYYMNFMNSHPHYALCMPSAGLHSIHSTTYM